MKPAQWLLALVVLVVMVFLITFAMNYVGDSGDNKSGGNDPKQPPSYARLKFTDRKHPPEGGAPYEYQEFRQPGSHDFWFENDNAEPVKVGVEAKNCTCAGVELFVVPESERWKERQKQVAKAAAEQMGTAPVGVGLPNLLVAALPRAVGKDPELARLEEAATPVSLLDKTESATVPPGAVGWVRVRWSATETKGPKMLKATLWFGASGAGQLDLETRISFLPALRVVETDMVVGKMPSQPLGLANLPYRDEFICWSSTRGDFEPEAKILTHAGRPEDDPFTIGKPERLTEKERAELEKDLDTKNEKVLCAWRVPMTLGERGPGGKSALDLGPMRRRVELRIKGDPDVEPIEVKFSAVIKGDVQVDQRTPGRLDFGPFTQANGSKTETVQLSTVVPGVTLAIDAKRSSPFLEAKLPDQPATAGGRITWDLKISVPPGKASGFFPRDDDPTYQDSAVYVKVIPPAGPDAGPPRSIRIPVMGTATD
jgi:hypothetical protein